MKPKIIVDDDIPYIKGRLEPVADVVYVDQFDFTPEIVRDADALAIRTRTRCDATLLQGSRVKAIATATIGMDQIDIPWCREAGISVANAAGCNAPAVAQYVWSSLLRLGFDPEKDTLGIVGCGNVGGLAADWGRLLGAYFLVSDPRLEHAGADLPFAPLDEIFSSCKAVTLHTSLSKTGEYPSFHLIDEHHISLMHQNAIFINAARGPVLHTESALNAIVKRPDLKLAIDTWEGEPDFNRILFDRADYATPHIAGYSRQGKERATRMTLENLEHVFGFTTDKSGLADNYILPSSLSAEQILDSYDPATDTALLRSNPTNFEKFRNSYNYREEAPDIS